MDLVGLDAPGPDIRVVLAPESSPLAREMPAWVTGYTDGVSNVVVILAERTPSYPDGGLEEVLAHEVAHVLIHRAAGGRRVPRWFDEGLAMLAARTWRWRDQTELAVGLLSGPRVPLWKLDDLFQGDRRQVEHGYALSGTLVQDLLERYGSAVPRIVLARVAQGDTFDQAIRGATGATLIDVGEAFWERQGTLKRWIPILTSTAVLWFGISMLAIVAGIRKRRQRAAQAKAMEEAEIPAAGPDEAAAAGRDRELRAGRHQPRTMRIGPEASDAVAAARRRRCFTPAAPYGEFRQACTRAAPRPRHPAPQARKSMSGCSSDSRMSMGAS